MLAQPFAAALEAGSPQPIASTVRASEDSFYSAPAEAVQTHIAVTTNNNTQSIVKSLVLVLTFIFAPPDFLIYPNVPSEKS